MSPHTIQLRPGTRPVAVAILTEMLGAPRAVKGRGLVHEWGSVTLRGLELLWIESPRNNEAADAVRSASNLIGS